MDAWSPDQLKKMHLGGNDVVNNFLKQYGIDKYTDIKEKYNSQAAEVSDDKGGLLFLCLPVGLHRSSVQRVRVLQTFKASAWEGPAESCAGVGLGWAGCRSQVLSTQAAEVSRGGPAVQPSRLQISSALQTLKLRRPAQGTPVGLLCLPLGSDQTSYKHSVPKQTFQAAEGSRCLLLLSASAKPPQLSC